MGASRLQTICRAAGQELARAGRVRIAHQPRIQPRGLRRLMISVPVLTPRLSSLWLGLITPLYARVGRKLIDSIRHSTVVRNDAALQAFGVRPRGVPAAIASALRNEERRIGEEVADALGAGNAGGRG